MRSLQAKCVSRDGSQRVYCFENHNDAVSFERRVVSCGIWAEYFPYYLEPGMDACVRVDRSRRVRVEPDESRYSIYKKLVGVG